MAHMTACDFEARYRAHRDPWSYTTSAYEERKYAATLAACGLGPFAWALELGGSIGVFSAQLAPRCHHLTTIDAAPTAVAAACQRLAEQPNVDPILGSIPGDIPGRAYDLVVASEILYYLPRRVLDRTLETLRHRLVTGARLVAVHWRPEGPERPFSAEQVHRRLRSQWWLDPSGSDSSSEYLLDVFERR